MKHRVAGSLPSRVILALLVLVGVTGLPLKTQVSNASQRDRGAAAAVPRFEFDPTWPKQPFPNDWVLGMVLGLTVDPNDHIWISHRPETLTDYEKGAAQNPPTFGCCRPAPAVMEFDMAGNIVQAWGGANGQNYDWPADAHGMTLDYKGNVWLTANKNDDSRVVKFARDGRFLLQIGQKGSIKGRGSNDVAWLGRPADIAVDRATNEVWVADGYVNKRVIIFDADTGAYKRHFGAYGNKPDDAPIKFNHVTDVAPPQQFMLPHCVKFSNDGLVYICDRDAGRIQVFRKDGTFVQEAFVQRHIPRATATDLAFSRDPEQRYAYLVDYASVKVWILQRKDLAVIGGFGYGGHFGGGFTIPHNIAIDSKGNLYVSEGLEGKRVQRFLYRGTTAGR